MERDNDHRESRALPANPDDLAAGFAIAGRDIALAIQWAEDEYGPARVRHCSLIRDSAASRSACSISAATFPAMA
jgi:hypothetical protein